MFKKFFQFISEGKKPKPHDIEQADPTNPPIDPAIVTKCPKCGSTGMICDCYTDDYYNAKLPQQAPRPNKKVKPKTKDNEKN